MSTSEDLRTLGRARLSFAREADIDEFAATLDKYERGEINADQWRAFRLVRGTYGQRQTDDASMLRIKIPQGVLTGEQLIALADVADRYSRGFGHITTRQNVQLHFVKLHDVEPAMRRIAEAGITTREACGNSVRNITACPYAGVSADEAFDVTPYADALTRYFLRHPLSASLPRKFKIAFEGCREDHAKTSIHDIGWRAKVQDDRRGFRVAVGGGTAILCTSGSVLFEFLPAGEMFNVAEAVVRVFHKLGDYKHKAHNRLKFLIKSLGWERFREEFDKALADVRAEGGVPLPFDPEEPPVERAPDWDRPEAPSVDLIARRVQAAELRGPGIHPETRPVTSGVDEAFSRWAATNVRRQKQDRYVTVIVTVPLGDLTSAQMRVLADLSYAYSDGAPRVTVGQNLIFRWVAADELPAFYRRLAAAGLGLADAETMADVTSCPGAESCKLAVTQSRGLGATLGEFLRGRPDLVAIAPELDIKISGCPNGCGQHHIAGIGFQGSLRKVDGRAVPQYFVMVGGGTDTDVAKFGRVVAKIPARRCTTALERLVHLYGDEHQPKESARAFFRRVDSTRVKLLLADLESMTAATANPDDYIDLAETKQFVPETMEGECAS
jgi:sulfite reductase (NADPH) hemoprotein beta-component